MELLSSISETWQSLAVDPLSGALTFIHDAVGSYAIAIVLFTIAIRLLMIPLTVKQIQSQRKMQLLQPEIAKMRKRLKGDRQGESQAVMQLYRKHGVNPLSGCLPIFVQLPVLLALYGGILTLSGRGLLNEQFLWFNLAREDATIRVIGEAVPTEPMDIRFVTDQRSTALESAISADFAQSHANYRFLVEAVEPDTAAQLLVAGRADALFLDGPLDSGALPPGTHDSRLVQSAALLVERDRFLTRLSEDEVRRILAGDLLSWAELNGAAAGPIVLHGIRDDIGSRALLSELLLDGQPIAVPLVLHDDVDAYLEAVRQNPNALGVSFPLETDDVRMVNIEASGAERAFMPTPTVLRDGNYALADDMFVYWAAAGDDAAREFLRRWWTSSQGQATAQAAGFTRLPPETGILGSGGFYISILALLAGAFQFVQARMMQQRTAEGQAATVNRVMQFMPIIVVVFAWSFQAGLVLYWVISSIISIIQQYFTTGTGKLVPTHWPIARDVMAEHRPAPAETDGPDGADNEPASQVVAASRRRRRRRKRGG